MVEGERTGGRYWCLVSSRGISSNSRVPCTASVRVGSRVSTEQLAKLSSASHSVHSYRHYYYSCCYCYCRERNVYTINSIILVLHSSQSVVRLVGRTVGRSRRRGEEGAGKGGGSGAGLDASVATARTHTHTSKHAHHTTAEHSSRCCARRQESSTVTAVAQGVHQSGRAKVFFNFFFFCYSKFFILQFTSRRDSIKNRSSNDQKGPVVVRFLNSFSTIAATDNNNKNIDDDTMHLPFCPSVCLSSSGLSVLRVDEEK